MAYERKTVDRWDIMTKYGDIWDCECSEYSRIEARKRAMEYRENTNTLIRIEKHREKKVHEEV